MDNLAPPCKRAIQGAYVLDIRQSGSIILRSMRNLIAPVHQVMPYQWQLSNPEDLDRLIFLNYAGYQDVILSRTQYLRHQVDRYLNCTSADYDQDQQDIYV
jgi:hypothetical protein